MSVKNPLNVRAALQMASLQVVLLVVDAVAGYWGNAGLMATAAVLGATDVDALTMSMAQLSVEAANTGTAVQALVRGSSSTRLSKP
jgi:uncharacterized membrane protein (DUF4010 family)